MTTTNRLVCDMLIIGGGINGASIARDAAGRGLSVVLCEKDDLAAQTSSASTKLIHGGLRYLEHREFSLVRKSLIEREILMRSAPHLIWPLQFVLPYDTGMRPVWMIRAGLFLYDHLARRELLPPSGALSLRTHAAGLPLKEHFKHGFIYSDGWVDDARLVVANALDAAEKGARVLTRTRCESALREDDRWHASLRTATGQRIDVSARSIVNATGPWAANFLQTVAHQSAKKPLRLIKGSHIVVRKMFAHPYAYLFQHPDKRVVFAIPYERDFTLIGTTDLDYHGSLDDVAIEPDEVTYLCALTNRYFDKPIGPQEVIWSYSGIRPLVDDTNADNASASAVTRDYRFELDQIGAPLLSIFGGKITTSRVLAEEVVNLLCPLLSHHGDPWTAQACLPGGTIIGNTPSNRGVIEFDRYLQQKQGDYAWLDPLLVARYVRAYGTHIDQLLERRNSLADMGEEIAPTLYAAEVIYLMQREWAITAADILWRRSKLGLHLPPDTSTVLENWIATNASDDGHLSR